MQVSWLSRSAPDREIPGSILRGRERMCVWGKGPALVEFGILYRNVWPSGRGQSPFGSSVSKAKGRLDLLILRLAAAPRRLRRHAAEPEAAPIGSASMGHQRSPAPAARARGSGSAIFNSAAAVARYAYSPTPCMCFPAHGAHQTGAPCRAG